MTEHSDRFNPHTLDHLAFLILGNPRQEEWTGPPPYRTGREIERWMRHFVPEFVLGPAGRFPETRDALEVLNTTHHGRETLKKMIAAALHPPDYAQFSYLLDEDISTFNNHLWYDGYRLIREPRTIRLEQIYDQHVVAKELEDTLSELRWEIVLQEFRRMIENTERDPEDAITAACALVESVCRSILVDMQVELPKDRSVVPLYKATAKSLGLSADRHDFPPEVAEESRRILGSLAGTVAGIGHLRTKSGDAHGREYTVRRVDARMARLAIGSAATISEFLIETWQKERFA